MHDMVVEKCARVLGYKAREEHRPIEERFIWEKASRIVASLKEKCMATKPPFCLFCGSAAAQPQRKHIPVSELQARRLRDVAEQFIAYYAPIKHKRDGNAMLSYFVTSLEDALKLV